MTSSSMASRARCGSGFTSCAATWLPVTAIVVTHDVDAGRPMDQVEQEVRHCVNAQLATVPRALTV